MTEGNAPAAWILLVEDNLTDAILAQAVLERDGDLRVILAQDGIRGCQMVESQRWDLVITDLNLPGRDGIEVLRSSRKHQPDTPVIVMSAYTEPGWTQAAERAGVSETLTKPLDPRGFSEAVRSLLEHSLRLKGGQRTILAVSALPGDVEAGCSGALLKYATRGDRVEVLVLSNGLEEGTGVNRRRATSKACELLGFRVHLPPDDTPDLPVRDRGLVWTRDLVEELSPELILAPSAHDVRDSRQNAFEIADLAGAQVQDFLCYQAATTTLAFHPGVFEEISESLDQKMLALSFFNSRSCGRPHLDPDLARATARYWGRFLGYGHVEPFEVVRQTL